MPSINYKDFLAEGFLLQLSPDLFKVIVGPFVDGNSLDTSAAKSSTFIYRPHFWSFLEQRPDSLLKTAHNLEFATTYNRVEIIGLLERALPAPFSIKWQEVSEDGFVEQFEWTQRKIKAGQLQKTVPIIEQRGIGKFDLHNRAHALLSLLKSDHSGWIYAFFSNDQAEIGLSPELLADWNSDTKTLQTVALAGTLPISSDAEKNILADQKINLEHQLVITDIRRQLSKWKASPEETKAFPLKHMVHLKTEFKLKIESFEEAWSAVNALHPTAAMGMYPRQENLMIEFSQLPIQRQRQSFASPFGIVSREKIFLVVSIRSLHFSKGEFCIRSGCGVTGDSQLALELNELEVKRNSVKKMLGLIDD